MAKAWIYNPLDDMDIMAYGRTYHLKAVSRSATGITAIPDLELREVDEEHTWGELRDENDNPNEIQTRKNVVAGERVAHELVRKRELEQAGLRILQANAITAAEATEALAQAETYKRARIQEFQQERMERNAGGHGRLRPDERVRRWILELGIEDPVENPARRAEPLTAETLASALMQAQSAMLTRREDELLRKKTKEKEPVGA